LVFPCLILLKLNSAKKTLTNRILAPIYPRKERISPKTKYAKTAEKTGSRDKMSPVWVALVYCCTWVCTMYPTAVQSILRDKTTDHEKNVLGSLTDSVKHENIVLKMPTNPSCNIPSVIESTCFVNIPVTTT